MEEVGWLGGGGVDNIWTGPRHQPLPPTSGSKVSAGPETLDTRSAGRQVTLTVKAGGGARRGRHYRSLTPMTPARL